MIKIWNVRIKLKNPYKEAIRTIGIEEANHELIVWKYWVGFCPKNDFFHQIILRQNLYTLMSALLKIGLYSICMKREDKERLYSANIIGISPYMLENITGYERHTIAVKLEDLKNLGYISYTAPTRGEMSEMNILLNEYSKSGLQVFQIRERDWLREHMIVNKESLIGEYSDVRNVENRLVELLPIGGGEGEALVESLPINIVGKSVDNYDSLVEPLPIKRVNIVDDLVPAVDFTGEAKALIDSIGGIVDSKNKNGGYVFNPSNHPTSVQIVAMFYQQETGMELTEQDVSYIVELLKINMIPQIVAAIQTTKIWRATLPTNFDTLSEEEKKKRVEESQPGFFLRIMGMRHVYNFLKNSPRYRKKGKKGVSTGVVSGLNKKRVMAQQNKIIKEIREKHKHEIEQIK